MAGCCCGCVLESSGSVNVIGDGSKSFPYQVSLVDPNWKRPSARLQRTTNQSVLDGANPTVVAFDTEVFDQGSFWAIGNPTLITVPEDGIYIFGACALWQANGTGTRELGFRRNGLTVVHMQDQPTDTFNAGANLYMDVSYQLPMGAGETLEVIARQESTVTLNLIAEADDSIVFWIVYAGRVV